MKNKLIGLKIAVFILAFITLIGIAGKVNTAHAYLRDLFPTGGTFGGWGTAYTMGYRFTPVSTGQITTLWCFSSGSSTVTLWSDAGTSLASTTITCNAGWVSGAITPVNVTAGTYYRVTVWGGNYYGSISVPNTTTGITITGGWYSSGSNVFPTADAASTIYGMADVTWASGAPPPASATTTGNSGYAYNYFYSAGTVTNNTGNTASYGTAWGPGSGYSGTACSSLPYRTDYTTVVTGTNNLAIYAYVSASPSTVYYFCVYVRDPVSGLYYFSPTTYSLTTPPPPAPAIAYDQSSAVDDTSATVGSGVVTYGSATTAIIRYGTSNVACSSLPSVTSSFNILADNGNNFANTTRLTGLSPSTIYYWCMVATSANGTGYGAVNSLTTTATATAGCDLLPSSTLASAANKTTLNTYLGTSKFQGTLLYRATLNGWTPTNFHTGVDAQGENIVMYKNFANNAVFGGYMPQSWVNSGGVYLNGSNAFLFSLTDGYKLNQLYSVYQGYSATNYGPSFGPVSNLYDGTNPMNTANAGYTNSGNYYQAPSSQGAFNYLNGGAGVTFTPSEIEVYKISVCTASAPTVTTPTNTSITASGATLGGNVTSAGTQAVSGRGVCVGTSANPVLGGTCFSTTGTTGVFTVGATGLLSNTLYHYRGYATNSVGTSYTTDDTFTTLNVNPTAVSTSAPTGLNSYYATLNGSANPNGYATTGHFRVFPNTSPGSCTSDSLGIRFPLSASNDPALGSGSTGVNYSYTIPFNSGTFLTPNTTYYYCSYAVNANGTTGASSVASFITPFGPKDPCDAPMTGSLSLPATASCSFNGTTADGVDAGSGTTNTANILLNTGVSLTLNSGQTIGRGGISMSGGTLTLAAGGGLLRGGVWVNDADGDGVLDSNVIKVQATQPAGYVRRTAFKAIATNSAALAYVSNILPITTYDCNPSSIFAYQYVPNLVTDADNDGYKTVTAAGTQCVGGTSVINGRTYYRDATGAYTFMDAASALGGGATDCNDASAAPCAPTPGSVTTINGTSVTVSWSASTGPSPTSYTVTCVSGGTCSNTNRGTQTSGFTDSALTCGTSYTYNVTAVNAAGSSPASSNFSGTTGSCSGPPIVTTDAANVQTGTTAYLNSTVNPNSASTSITYRYQTASTGTCNASTPTSTIAGPSGLTGSSPLSGGSTWQYISGLAPSTTYYYCATANNSIGTTYGSVVSFTTPCNSVTWYRDLDADGYGSATSGTLTQCTQPAGYVANNLDCYDGNANAKPGTLEWYSTNRGDGSFDYNCDNITSTLVNGNSMAFYNYNSTSCGGIGAYDGVNYNVQYTYACPSTLTSVVAYGASYFSFVGANGACYVGSDLWSWGGSIVSGGSSTIYSCQNLSGVTKYN